MIVFQIRCFNAVKPVLGPHFFILSKGLNSGRPSFSPNRNCFVLTCSRPEDLQQIYWVVYALWAAGKFRPYLVGSVILFIHKRELLAVITAFLRTHGEINGFTSAMIRITELEKLIQERQSLIKEWKKTAVNHLLRAGK